MAGLEANECAIVAFRMPRASLSVRKIIKGIGGKTIDEAIAETEVRKQAAKAELGEAIGLEQAQALQAAEARAEYDQVHAEVALKIQEELAAVEKHWELQQQKNISGALRGELFEAQRKVALLELISSNREQMKLMADQCHAAKKAAEEANKAISEEKKLMKQALEATRRAWDDMDKKGGKRTARAVACETDADLPCSKRPTVEGKLIPSPSVSQSKPVEVEESEPALAQSPERSELEVKGSSEMEESEPTLVQSLKHSELEVKGSVVDMEEAEPTSVQSLKHSETEVEETSCDLLHDAQSQGDLD